MLNSSPVRSSDIADLYPQAAPVSSGPMTRTHNVRTSSPVVQAELLLAVVAGSAVAR